MTDRRCGKKMNVERSKDGGMRLKIRAIG